MYMGNIKKSKTVSFTKKKTKQSSFQKKIEKANDLLERTVFIKKVASVTTSH